MWERYSKEGPFPRLIRRGAIRVILLSASSVDATRNALAIVTVSQFPQLQGSLARVSESLISVYPSTASETEAAHQPRGVKLDPAVSQYSTSNHRILWLLDLHQQTLELLVRIVTR